MTLPNLTARRLLGNRVLVLVPLSGRALAGGFRASPCAGAPHGSCVLAHAHHCRAALASSACPGPCWSLFRSWRLAGEDCGACGVVAVRPGRQPAGAGLAGEGSHGPGRGWNGDPRARAAEPAGWAAGAGRAAAAAQCPTVCSVRQSEVPGGTWA